MSKALKYFGILLWTIVSCLMASGCEAPINIGGLSGNFYSSINIPGEFYYADGRKFQASFLLYGRSAKLDIYNNPIESLTFELDKLQKETVPSSPLNSGASVSYSGSMFAYEIGDRS